MTLTHELSHSLGTVDLYSTNCFGSGLTLMTCTIYPNDDDRRTFHLDPWHKMTFGWLSPRIFTLGSGGVATITALNPAAIINGGSDLIFEWVTALDTWVDFLYVGPETGGFAQPFNTLAEGLTAVSHGGTLNFKPGASGETAVISKRVTLQAVGGPVLLGQP